MSAQFTLKFDGWAPDLQNVALEADGSSGSVPCADCLNVYYQDAAFRCLPGPNPFGPALGEQALNLFSGYDNIAADNYVYAASAENIWLLQDGAWSQLQIEPQVNITATPIQINFTQGGATNGALVYAAATSMFIKTGISTATGGLFLNGTMQAGTNTGGSVVGYVRASYGSLSQTATYGGVTLKSLISTPGTTALTLAGSFARNYFSNLILPSIHKVFGSQVATVTYSGGNTQWLWNSSAGFQTGTNYTVWIGA